MGKFSFLFTSLLLICFLASEITYYYADSQGIQQPFSKAILEMLHINTLTFPQRTKLHPYMRQIYQRLSSSEAKDSTETEGTLVQSFRSIKVPEYDNPGWLWFNISSLKPSMLAAELVLLRRTLHPKSLTINVTIHTIGLEGNNLSISDPLDKKILNLSELPSSGYDTFNVSIILRQWQVDVIGFQFQFTDDSGSLVLHDALTQSLYCLNTSSQDEPLLITYRLALSERSKMANLRGSRSSQQCTSGWRRSHLPRRDIPGECNLHQWFVSLRSSELNHWILEPQGYYANFCRGHCFSTVSDKEKAVSTSSTWDPVEQNTTKSQRWYCTPQRYSSIKIMYITEYGNIFIENLKEMSIESCACK
ncbi:LOW QUALITY PROTEIN: bone morphogenetic protein 4 [Pristis pectinata]|uniref:LOW QUALITY PROTEIN: bone morphogenetic protein 4 n=1 Tax=Pristis pectinata TaxID=685728 RepID=UPI00223E1F40|nr:LOW QUALITY PROTEIN: bone morphogenetic protein 4 [Pristis pectinata]